MEKIYSIQYRPNIWNQQWVNKFKGHIINNQDTAWHGLISRSDGLYKCHRNNDRIVGHYFTNKTQRVVNPYTHFTFGEVIQLHRI